MLSLKTLSFIDNKTKITVHGWIRENQRKSTCMIIPPVIDIICILYYRLIDVFEIVDVGVNLSHNKTIISSTPARCSTNRYFRHLNYGTMTIESRSKTICRWVLQINKLRQRVGILYVGISSSTETNTTFNFCAQGHKLLGYDVYLLDDGRNIIDRKGIVGRYGIGFAKGDQVSLHLDLVKRQIKYYINDKDQGIAFQGVTGRKSVKYRLVVGLLGADDDAEIEMLQFIKF